eukprot:SAG31_NODE_2946_length_4874_cov_1.638534_5_plen_178_part_00
MYARVYSYFKIWARARDLHPSPAKRSNYYKIKSPSTHAARAGPVAYIARAPRARVNNLLSSKSRPTRGRGYSGSITIPRAAPAIASSIIVSRVHHKLFFKKNFYQARLARVFSSVLNARPKELLQFHVVGGITLVCGQLQKSDASTHLQTTASVAAINRMLTDHSHMSLERRHNAKA